MQIDFHHAVTYVAARGAGFSHEDAAVVAHAAQFVDDATSCGTVQFDVGAMYIYIDSAHPALNAENLCNPENRLVWVPFHFLPGNGGMGPGQRPGGTFVNKLVCRPGHESPPAQDMVNAAIARAGEPNGLHRLGIAMHVFADTWAHQGFAGVIDGINDLKDPEALGSSGERSDPVREPGGFTTWLAKNLAPPVGHGRAGVLPDMPYLVWQYRDSQGRPVTRDNTSSFCTAADEMCRAMQRYRKRLDAAVAETGLNARDLAAIRGIFVREQSMDGGDRHRAWVKALQDGVFQSCGSVTIAYDAAAWRDQALGPINVSHQYAFTDAFLQSDWKRFQDALQEQRLTVMHEILPRYGICVG